MDQLNAQLERLHAESFGWALCCCRRDRHRAEEVLQQVYLKVLSGKARHRGEGSFKTWLFAVIRLTARDEARRHWLAQFRFTRFARSAEPEPQASAHGDDETAGLVDALDTLPPRQRETLHLVFYQELSIAQAAEVMRISVGSARTHYERGKAAIRQTLSQQKIFDKDSHHEPRRQQPALPVL